MDPTGQTICFAGDLRDPWVADMAEALSGLSVVTYEHEGDHLPPQPFPTSDAAKILVLHRSHLTSADVARLEEQRRGLGAEKWPRIVLCVSPYVRYAELERCSNLVELVVPEATARETLPSQVARMLGKPRERPQRLAGESVEVAVISSDYELRRVLGETCLRAGYRAIESSSLFGSQQAPSEAGDRSEPQPDLTIWDVPLLESRWAEQLERRCRTGPVVALLGFADRAAVSLARKAGASACLDQPCAMDDLIHVLDRLAVGLPKAARRGTTPRVQAPHAIPPPPLSQTHKRRAKVRRRAAGDV